MSSPSPSIAHESPPTASALVFPPVAVVVASIAAALAVAVAGSLSEISLGDENVHLRQVQTYVDEGYRAPSDPLFNDGRMRPIAFSSTPLWHAGLAVLWSVTGQCRFVAQAYQAAFYLLLVLSVYFAARRMWGPAAASWAWLIAATMPMVAAFSVVLYQDMPGAAVSALALLMLWRRDFFWAGLCVAGAYLVKMNMLVFAPWAVVFALAWAQGSWKRRLLSAALVAAPVLVTTAYDFLWRREVYDVIMGYSWTAPTALAKTLRAQPANYVVHRTFTLGQPLAVISHLGALGLVGAVAALLRSWDRPAKCLWLCVALALAGCLYVFRHSLQMRYLFPVVLLLIFLGGRALADLRMRPVWKLVLVALAALQVAPTLAYVHRQRAIPAEERAAYRWVREHTAPQAHIMCPEMRLTVQTGRPIIWGDLNPAYLMAEASPEERQRVFQYFRTTYVAVPRRRIFDAKLEGNHDWGYPQGFIDYLNHAPGVVRVFENDQYVIYRLETVEESAPDSGRGAPSNWPAANSSARAT